MIYTLQTFREVANGIYTPGEENPGVIKYIITDSRKALFPKFSCFFAIPGIRRDGHDFIEEMYQRGVRNFVIEKQIDTLNFSGANFLQVNNVIQALQAICAYHRSQFDLPIVGITGSNGKTIVKEWLFQLLQDDLRIVKNPGSFNSQIGVPLSVWQIESNHQLGIFEAGISTTGEMDNLSKIIRCDTGILVNIGSAHDAGFESRAEKLREKLRLFTNCDVLVYHKWNEINDTELSTHLPKAVKLVSWSLDKDQNGFFKVAEIQKNHADHNTHIQARVNGEMISLIIPFDQDIDIENAMHCITWMLYHGYSPKVINNRLKRLEHITMRLEMKKGIKDTLVINDTYSNDPESLIAALRFLKQQSGSRMTAIVLSDFEQQNSSFGKLWPDTISELLQQYRPALFVGISEAMKQQKLRLPDETTAIYYSNTEELLQGLDQLPIEGKALLFKGARSYRLERAVNKLLAQSHSSTLEINLRSMANNFTLYSSLLQPDTEMMIMLKAFAYGSGDIELARFFESARVAYFAVAYIDEGIKLRQGGIQTPILVLNPDPDSLYLCTKYKLEPEVFSLVQFKRIIQNASSEVRLKVHIKLDTGMYRLGFVKDDLGELILLLKEHPWIHIESVMTHMSASEVKGRSAFTHTQMKRYVEMYDKLVGAIGYSPIRHAMNSAGILNFPEYQMDMVRLGIGLYGVSGAVVKDIAEEPVHTLKARVSQIKTIPPGETVGYAQAWRAKKQTTIAIVNIGYADGIMRKAGNGNANFLINDKLAPTVGNICMDMCMIDITEHTEVREGDEVVIFSNQLSVVDLAYACETTVYEILSRISPRINRVYLED